MGRRADGYHLIQSLFWPLDFGDELRLEPSSKLEVEAVWAPDAPVPTKGLPQGRENLVFRAAEKALRGESAWSVEIQKRVPMGAGLGGGSSNAGSLLAELRRQGQIDEATAEQIALGLGADVPFFLGDTPSWVEGIGEKRQAVRVSKPVRENLSFLLVLPPRATPTPVLFAKYRSLGLPFARRVKWDGGAKALDWKTLKTYLTRAENSLQSVAALEYPLIQEVLAELEKTQPLHAAMSGTGSTCFAVYTKAETARRAAKDLLLFCRKSNCQSILARTHWG
ncbi:hypothetical protein K2X33_08035, partial [bacterium]|nr:hypothetical protein [bacterium]